MHVLNPCMHDVTCSNAAAQQSLAMQHRLTAGVPLSVMHLARYSRHTGVSMCVTGAEHARCAPERYAVAWDGTLCLRAAWRQQQVGVAVYGAASQVRPTAGSVQAMETGEQKVRLPDTQALHRINQV
jgi:hypothetical protein